MANLEWLLCLLRVAMYWDAHACNDVTDTSTEYRVHLLYSEWRVVGCALSYDKVISGGPPAIRYIHVKIDLFENRICL